MAKVFIDDSRNVVFVYKVSGSGDAPYSDKEIAKKNNIEYSSVIETDYEPTGVVESAVVNENDEVKFTYKEASLIYNASTFLAWCMSEPLQSEEFQALDNDIKMQAVTYTMRFGDNANDDGAALYRQAALLCDSLAGNTVCSEMAETIIAKAIELCANIEEV